MKCGELKQLDLAKAYAKALAQTEIGADVNMDALAPHLKETGSSCGACPALLPLAKTAFENNPGVAAELAAREESTMDVVRDAVSEIVPGFERFFSRDA